MTDRIQHLTVLLEHDIRDDDVQALVLAIAQLRGVSLCQMGKPVDLTDHMARERAKMDLRRALSAVLEPSR
ncbi:hypothetical protein KABACHOK_02130 [Brevundimonas phage vB_BpoS-Kabachok]|uniref:Uncharacterized protein n=1 Tax=Brevundimonas phage vB_BpoS-Kabachok TaxID=2948600 RepID=A0A9E7SK18_9CAUD|nr:hypothetical protein KABACHOK_02130 [Brevundimonas phage vB_BpoS-Kabachok]